MIRSDGYPNYECSLKKPNVLTIEKEKALSMVDCVSPSLLCSTLSEKLANAFKEGLEGIKKECEKMNHNYGPTEVNIDGIKHFADIVVLQHDVGENPRIIIKGCSIDPKELKKGKENMTTNIENRLTEKEFRDNVKVSFKGMTCNIERANIAHNWNEKGDIGFRIIGTIPKPEEESFEDRINKLVERMCTNLSYRLDGVSKYEIKDVRFNPPATIVFWQDGTKTVVKASNEDFDPEKGLAMAVTKKLFGNKYEYFNQVKKWTKKYYKAHPAGDA